MFFEMVSLVRWGLEMVIIVDVCMIMKLDIEVY